MNCQEKIHALARIDGITPSERLVMIAIIIEMDEDMECRASLETLSKSVHTSRSAASRSTKKLEAMGLVEKRKGGGRGRFTIYRLGPNLRRPDNVFPFQEAVSA